MRGNLIVLDKKTSVPDGFKEIDTTSHGYLKTKLSPFYLGPISCYQGLIAKRMENAWQFSKVYPNQVDMDYMPLPSWYKWRDYGFSDTYAHRYPMGHSKPLYSFWNGQKLSYVDARKQIYIPLYVQAVTKTSVIEQISDMLDNGENIALRDFDGYNHKALGMTYEDVLECETRRMGHGFVVAMLLEAPDIISKYCN